MRANDPNELNQNRSLLNRKYVLDKKKKINRKNDFNPTE